MSINNNKRCRSSTPDRDMFSKGNKKGIFINIIKYNINTTFNVTTNNALASNNLTTTA